MKKFLILYKSEVSAAEQMAKATPEEAKAGMEAWMAWAAKAGSALLDMGAPLGGNTVVAKGAAPAASPVSGYSILQAEDLPQVKGLLENHPHLMMPGASIEICEALKLPGM